MYLCFNEKGVFFVSIRIGCCITPHGFGHAARAAAVMEAVGKQMTVEFVVVTTVAEWFFKDSLRVPFRYYPLATDIGLVQNSPFIEDLEATQSALDDFYPLPEETVTQAVQMFAGCDLILCDIAALGIVAAQRLGIPSLLLENFTWDWIYTGYLEKFPALQPHIEYLKKIYSQATYHLKTAPVCQPDAALEVIPPISRSQRTSSAAIRRQLRLTPEQKIVLITLGGVAGDEYALEPLAGAGEYVFLLTGKRHVPNIPKNVLCIPQSSGLYHPDLAGAADVVIGKVGYSTLAEVYAAGVPFGYILRDGFRESSVLADFISRELACLEVKANDFKSGNWMLQLDMLIQLQPVSPKVKNGAGIVARHILDMLS